MFNMKISYLKTVNLLSYYVLPFLSVLIYLSLLFYESRTAYSFSVLAGIWAWWLLVFIMFIRPLVIIFPNIKILKKLCMRKQLGVLDTWFFLIHGFGTILHKELFSLTKFFGFSNSLFWGLLAGIIMFLLGITSNIKSTKTLNKIVKNGWKKFHRSAYLLFVFTAIHAFLISDKMIYLVLTFIYLVLKILEFRRVKFSKVFFYVFIILFLCLLVFSNNKEDNEKSLKERYDELKSESDLVTGNSQEEVVEIIKEEIIIENPETMSESSSEVIPETKLIPNLNELVAECKSLCKVDEIEYCEVERTLVYDENTYTKGSCRTLSKYLREFSRCQGYCNDFGKADKCNIDGKTDANCDGI